ncbi:hypothetical protein ACKKBG_A27700 [Auxenochlorella protothecoides x Auxenochlorella symbiontica]
MAEADGATERAQASGSCATCGKGLAKYRCPRCTTRSCSLECVKAHKQQSGCSGKRDRTAFLGRAQLDERSLLSDLRFLEEVQLADEVAKRAAPARPAMLLPRGLQTLLQQAKRRGVELHLLPMGMAARKTNTTRYNPKQGIMEWRLEWKFQSAPNFKPVNARVKESVVVGDLLDQHLASLSASLSSPDKSALQAYIDADRQSQLILLKKHGTPANSPLYYRIDRNATLEAALKKKEVVEYPTFIVALHTEGFDLVEGQGGGAGLSETPALDGRMSGS